MKRNLLILLAILLSAETKSFAQGDQTGGGSSAVNTAGAGKIQPKIMVLPRIKDGEELKKVYDSSMNLQIAITKINEAFLKRGANIIPFAAKFREAQSNATLNKSVGNTEDFKSMLLSSSGADIYVEAKMDVVAHPSRNASSVTIILEGYQNGTTNLLGSKVGSSRMNQTSDIGLLTMQAMDSITDAFLNLMQLKFDEIAKNGQSVYLEFNVAPGANFNFDSEIGSDKKLLSEVVDEWLQAHAVNGVFNTQGISTNQMILSDVKIPLRNPSNPKANYTSTNFFSDILKFFRTINVPIKRETGNNNKIMITIQ